MAKLIDCPDRNRQFPLFFQAPCDEMIDALRPGDCVKLIFDDVERMWVQIAEAKADGTFAGTLSNGPLIVDHLVFGDPIEFGAKHICDIERPRTTPVAPVSRWN